MPEDFAFFLPTFCLAVVSYSSSLNKVSENTLDIVLENDDSQKSGEIQTEL